MPQSRLQHRKDARVLHRLLLNCTIGYCDPCLVGVTGPAGEGEDVVVTKVTDTACSDPPAVTDADITEGLTGGPYTK